MKKAKKRAKSKTSSKRRVTNAGIFEGLFIPARAVERGLRSRAATGLAGLNAGRHKRVILDRAITATSPFHR
jgi:hypothetical protein